MVVGREMSGRIALTAQAGAVVVAVAVAFVVALLATQAGAQEVGPQSPYDGPNVVPGVVEAEDFDLGDQGAAFDDTTPENLGGAYRDAPVDIYENVGQAGFSVGHTRDGEWLEYTVSVDTPGNYDVVARAASGYAVAGKLQLDVDGAEIETTAIGGTGGWWNFADASLGTVALDGGESVIRITWIADGPLPKINLDSLAFVANDSEPVAPLPPPPGNCGGLTQEAEAGTFTGNVSIVTDEESSGGAYVLLDSGSRYTPFPTENYVDLCFDVPEAGVYRIDTISSGSDMYVTVDDGEPFVLRTPYVRTDAITSLRSTAYYPDPTPPVDLFDLDAGIHTVRFYEQRANGRLDTVALVRTQATGEAVCGEGERAIEDARLAGRYIPDADGGAGYALVVRGTGGASSPGDSFVEYCVTVEASGTYRIDADVATPTRDKNSFFVTVDGGPAVTATAHLATTPTTQEADDNETEYLFALRGTVAVNDIDGGTATWDLEPGDHTIRFYLRHDGVPLYNMELVPDGERHCTIDGRVVPTKLDQASCDAAADYAELFFDVGPTLRPIGNDPCGWTGVTVTGPTLSRSWGITCSSDGDVISELTAPLRYGPCETNETLPASFADVPGLRSINFYYACIDSLPPEIANMTSLETLDVSYNRIETLPAEIGNLSSLQTLALNGNRLRGDITVLNPLRQAISMSSLSGSGNDCLTTTSEDFAAFLDGADPDWARCRFPFEPEAPVNGYDYDFFEGPIGGRYGYGAPDFYGPTIPVVTGIDDLGDVLGRFPAYVSTRSETDYGGFIRSDDGSIEEVDFAIADRNDRGDLTGTVGDPNWYPRPKLLLADGTDVSFADAEFLMDAGGFGEGASSVAINEQGDIAGEVCCTDGFLRFADGTAVTFAPPGATSLSVAGLNDRGEVAGSYGIDVDRYGGFIRADDGSFTLFDLPGQVFDRRNDHAVSALNERGDVVGTYEDAAGFHGYIRTADGSVTTIDMPGGTDTRVVSMNEVGDVVGWYTDAEGDERSFVRTAAGAYATIDAGTGGIFRVAAINNRGDVAGNVGNLGFVASILEPNEPPSEFPVLPTSVEAEDYFRSVDSDAGNQGPASSFVGDTDVWPRVGGDGFVVGRIRPGESTSYKVSVAEAASYSFVLSHASGASGGTATVRVDGVKVGQTTRLGSTGSWWNFAETTIGAIDLAPGDHIVTIQWGQGQSNFDSFTVTAGGSVIEPAPEFPVLPTSVEAEDYFRSVDSDAGNQGPASSFVGDTDVWPRVGGDGFVVGRIRPGESTSYKVSVAEAASYSFVLSHASGASGGTATVRVDGVKVGQTTRLGSTGSWWNFADTTIGAIDLAPGDHIVTIQWGQGQSNFDSFTVTTE